MSDGGRHDCPAGRTTASHLRALGVQAGRHNGLDMNDDTAPVATAPTRSHVVRAFNLSLGFVLLLVAIFTAQGSVDWRPWAVAPHETAGLWGLVGAPLLHGSIEHLAANAAALLILGTLAGAVYPKATLRALPILWLGSGVGAWALGDIGTRHLGASGLTHGLMFLVFALGLLRRDRPAIATSLIAFLFYGSMLVTILPHEPGVSWQSHMGGAMAGIIAALLWRKADPKVPRKRYSWEDEEEEAQLDDANEQANALELPSPVHVPVLWQRVPSDTRGNVIEFRPRPPEHQPPGPAQ